MSRGRPVRFVGEQLDHVVALLKKYGPSKTRAILAAPLKHFGKPHKLGTLRSAKMFPSPESVSLPTLCKIGKQAGIEFTHGRVNPLETAKNASKVKRHAISLVRQHGAVRAAEILAEEGTVVCAATLRTMAKDNGVKLVRGRRKAA